MVRVSGVVEAVAPVCVAITLSFPGVCTDPSTNERIIRLSHRSGRACRIAPWTRSSRRSGGRTRRWASRWTRQRPTGPTTGSSAPGAGAWSATWATTSCRAWPPSWSPSSSSSTRQACSAARAVISPKPHASSTPRAGRLRANGSTRKRGDDGGRIGPVGRDARDRGRGAPRARWPLALLATGLRPRRSPAQAHLSGEPAGLSLRRRRAPARRVQGAPDQDAAPRGRAGGQQELPRPHGDLPRHRRGALPDRGGEAPQGRVPRRRAQARDHVPPHRSRAPARLRPARRAVRPLRLPPAARDVGGRRLLPFLRGPQRGVPRARLARVELHPAGEDVRDGRARRAGPLGDGLPLPPRDRERPQGTRAGPAPAPQMVPGGARHVRALRLPQRPEVHPVGAQERRQRRDPAGIQDLRRSQARGARVRAARRARQPPLPLARECASAAPQGDSLRPRPKRKLETLTLKPVVPATLGTRALKSASLRAGMDPTNAIPRDNTLPDASRASAVTYTSTASTLAALYTRPERYTRLASVCSTW